MKDGTPPLSTPPLVPLVLVLVSGVAGCMRNYLRRLAILLARANDRGRLIAARARVRARGQQQ